MHGLSVIVALRIIRLTPDHFQRLPLPAYNSHSGNFAAGDWTPRTGIHRLSLDTAWLERADESLDFPDGDDPDSNAS